MKALITGGSGFIGRHLTTSLLAHGHDVIVLDNLSTSTPQVRADIEFVEGSVLDTDRLDRLVARVDTVFHLAAAVGVTHILDDPLGGLRTNLHGTENVLESALRHDARVMVTSTSEVYGHNTAGALHENSRRILGSPLVSRWSYAEAKALDETLAHLYWRHHDLPTVIIRPFNVVGPGQTGRYGMVVPRFVQQAIDGDPITVYGTGEQTRCFCHVADAVEALRLLIDHPGAYGDVYNVGRPEEVSIRALAERVVTVTGSSSEIRLVPYSEAYTEGFEDMERRVPDISKIRAAIGFEPTATLDDILRSVTQHEVNQRASLR